MEEGFLLAPLLVLRVKVLLIFLDESEDATLLLESGFHVSITSTLCARS